MNRISVFFTYAIAFQLITALCLNAQVKFEREFRIKGQEAPPLALSFIDSVFESSKVKWYAEVSHEGQTFEAKLKHNGKRFSIEFSTEGHILDVEYEIGFDDIPSIVKDNIEANLKRLFERYRITRVQRHMTASREGHYLFLKNGDNSGISASKYEMTIKGRENRKTIWYEFLFDKEGEIRSKMPIVFRNSDHLEF